jgi:hypothetical protein
MVRKVRRKVRTSTSTMVSRYGRRKRPRGSTLRANYAGGKRTGIWSFWYFPRAVARTFGAGWADPRRR